MSEARLFAYRTMLSGVTPASPPRNESARSPDALLRDELDSFWYVTNLSHLTYITTMLDSFLSDVTRFLLLRHPGAVGADEKITMKTILTAKSRAEIVNAAVSKKVKELGHLSFTARIEFLLEQFGLGFTLPSETRATLEHYSSIRNAAVHNQSIFEIATDSQDRIDARPRTCARHPTLVTADDFDAAKRAYSDVVDRVYRATAFRVLKMEEAHLVNFAFLASKRGEGGA